MRTVSLFHYKLETTLKKSISYYTIIEYNIYNKLIKNAEIAQYLKAYRDAKDNALCEKFVLWNEYSYNYDKLMKLEGLDE